MHRPAPPSPAGSAWESHRNVLPVQIGIVGAGPWGGRLIGTARALEHCRVSMICDLDSKRLSAYSDQQIRLTTRIEDVSRDASIRAVLIATPPETHARLAVAMLLAGKHVFVEKPLALSSRDAAAIGRAAEHAGRRVMVGHVLRYHPALVEVSALVEDGAFGDVWHFSSHRFGRTRGSSSDAWWELAPHDVSLVCAFFRAEPLWIAVSRSECREAVRARLLFTRGRSAELLVGRSPVRRTRRTTLFGTRGAIRLDDRGTDARLRIHTLRADGKRCVEQRTIEFNASGGASLCRAPSTLKRKPPLCLELEHFITAIQHGSPILTDQEEGRRVVAVLEAGWHSLAADGKWMPVQSEVAGELLLTAEVA